MRHARLAFTLVELLVVIAVIGILVALLLPAVQAAREAARRAQCVNNLKQIGLGLHNYHATYNAFPLTTTGAEAYGSQCGSGFYSWLAMLLPFVEQSTLHDAIDFRQPMMDSCNQMSSSDYQSLSISGVHLNARAAATVVPLYLCPSDFYRMTPVMGTANPAPGNYAANIGWPRQCTGLNGQAAPLSKINGALGTLNPKHPDPWQEGRVTLASFTDGLSNTVAVAERLVSSAVVYQDMAGTPVGLHSFCGGGGATRSLARWESFCYGVTYPDPAFSITLGRAWISGWTLVGNTYMHVMPVNQRHCHIYGGEDNGMNIVTPGSRHPGGVNVVMSDGAVTFVSETVDQVVWWSAGSRNGGEPAAGGPGM